MFWQIPLLIALSLLMGKLVVSGLPAYYLFGGFACALIAFITFSKPKAGLVVLVFSMEHGQPKRALPELKSAAALRPFSFNALYLLAKAFVLSLRSKQ